MLLRHPRPLVEPGICYGQTDLPLKDPLERVAPRVEESIPAVDAIISSPLARCAQLAAALCEQRNLELTIDTDLTEIDFGAWEMKAWSDIPRYQIDEWADDVEGACPHGGESVASLKIRVNRALNRSRAPSTLWVSHSGVYRAALSLLGENRAYDCKIGYEEIATLID